MSSGFGKKELAIELFGIVFAVLFALWVDEWHDNARLTELAARQKARILSELHSNLSEVQHADEGNHSFLEKMQSLTKNKNWWTDSSLDPDKLNWSFLSADLKDAAWKTTLLTNVAPVMDADFLADASNIYKHQDLYDGFVASILNNFDYETVEINTNIKNAVDRHSSKLLIAADISRQLEDEYRRFLKKYGDEKAASPAVKPAQN